jgi:DUF3048 family protein
MLLTGCGGSGSKARTRRTVHTVASTTTSTTLPPVLAPLTGSPENGAAAVTRAALAVKIDNHPLARPQSGLAVADVVYEEVVEGSITRFMAVFNSQAPDAVGPIRSVRSMDPNLVGALGGIVAYSGGTDDNVALMRRSPAVNIDETTAGAAFFRDGAREAPHNLFGRPTALWERGGNPIPPKPLFSYVGSRETCAGNPVQSVRVGFISGYDPTYTYDASKGTWARAYGTTPFVDASGAQIAPQNVIVQLVRYLGAGGDGQIIGSGEAWVFCDGRGIHATWSKPSSDAPTQYTDDNGVPIRLRAGRTWVELLPTGSAVDVVAAPVPPSTTSTLPPTTTTTKATKK